VKGKVRRRLASMKGKMVARLKPVEGGRDPREPPGEIINHDHRQTSEFVLRDNVYPLQATIIHICLCRAELIKVAGHDGILIRDDQNQ
jgi:hypothetical protein